MFKFRILICLCSAFLFSTANAQSTQEPVMHKQKELKLKTPQKPSLRYALFWSKGKTWLVDSEQGVLFSAPTLIANGPNGHLLEYKLNLHTERLKSNRPYGDLYRWVSLDRYVIGGSYVDQLTNHFDPDELTEETHDEHQIFQFTGEFVTLIRWFYHQPNEAQHNQSISIYSLALNGVQPLPQMKKANKLLDFTHRLYPKLIPRCLKTNPRLVRWELSAQRPIFWLVMSPQTSLNCSVGLSALRVNPPPVVQSAGKLQVKEQSLYYKNEKLYGGVVDHILHPNGKVALTLEGAPRNDHQLFVKNINQLYEKQNKRYLSLWRAFDDGRAGGRHISFSDEVDIQRLDGARWLDANDPILSLLDSHFQPIGQKSCFRDLNLKRLDQYRRPKRSASFGQLCAVESEGRVWEGHEDLSASLSAQIVKDTIYLDIWVNDPERTERDELKIWYGSTLNPSQMRVTAKGIIGRDAIKSGVKVNWWEREHKRTQSKRSDIPYMNKIRGYQVHLQIPLNFTQGSLSLSVEDGDHSFPSAHQRLWLVGKPSASVVGLNQQVKPVRFEVP